MLSELSEARSVTVGDPKHAVFLHSPLLEGLSYPEDNPFKVRRAAMARKILRSMGLLTDAQERSAPAADRAALETFHTREYLDAMEAAEGGDLGVEGLAMGLGTADCPVFKGMVACAAAAAGATLEAARLLLAGEASVAFNPAGGLHHAGPSTASGFCYVNDVALACLKLAEHGRRVLFLDVDVHHGDGVQNAFYDRADVMTMSFHESGKTLFPGTGFPEEIGVGEGRGYSVNVPLPAGTGDDAYLAAFGELAVPLARTYNPDVIVLELGMDALAGDPLAHLALTNNAYAQVVETVMGFDKPILATGGGGYHPENTARGWALAWSILSGCDEPADAMPAMGGVLLESTDWPGGLRDRAVVPDAASQAEVKATIAETVAAVKANVFSLHRI